MKRRKLSAVICLVLAATMLISAGSLLSYADGTHGFYMTCDAEVTNNKSDGFMMDFYADAVDAWCTYYSNANWSMDIKESAKKLYPGIKGGGAYAGLQVRGPDQSKAGIMSMWR